MDIRTVLNARKLRPVEVGSWQAGGGGAIDRNWQAVPSSLIGGSEVAGCNDSRHWSATQDGDT